VARKAKTDLEAQLKTTLAANNTLGEFADTLIRWALYIGIAYVVIAYLLPLLALAFPVLKPIEAAAHAILAPFAAKAKADAEALGRDASAATHHLGQLIATKAPQIAAERSRSSRMAHRSRRYSGRAEAALRQANVL